MKTWTAFFLVLGIAGLIRAPIMLAGADAQLSLLADDASYYLEAARRTVETGSWPSMDGRNPTTGFHPLYMLVLLAIQALLGTDPQRIVPCTMLINLGLNVAAIGFLARVVLRPGRTDLTAVACCVAFACSPGWMAHGFVGVENGLSSLLVLLAAWRWCRRFAATKLDLQPLHGSWWLDGMILGGAMAARTDSVLFVALFLGATFVARMRDVRMRTALWNTASIALVAASLLVPWLVAATLACDTPVQDSGAAITVRFHRLHGSPFSPGWAAMTAKNIAFWGYRLGWLWGLMPLTGWLIGLASPFRRLRFGERFAFLVWLLPFLCLLALALRRNDIWFIDDTGQAGLELTLCVIGLLGGMVCPRTGPRQPVRWLALLGLWTALVAVAYSAVLMGFQLWYTTAPALVAIGMVTLPEFHRLVQGRTALAVVLVSLVAAQGVYRTHEYLHRGAFQGMSHTLLDDGEAMRDRITRVAAESTEPLRFGSFDSGELSYRLHPFPVTNLDGVMNHAASRAIQDDALARYLTEDGITHILGDMDRVSEFQQVSRFEVEPDEALTLELHHTVLRVVPLR